MAEPLCSVILHKIYHPLGLKRMEREKEREEGRARGEREERRERRERRETRRGISYFPPEEEERRSYFWVHPQPPQVSLVREKRTLRGKHTALAKSETLGGRGKKLGLASREILGYTTSIKTACFGTVFVISSPFCASLSLHSLL